MLIDTEAGRYEVNRVDAEGVILEVKSTSETEMQVFVDGLQLIDGGQEHSFSFEGSAFVAQVPDHLFADWIHFEVMEFLGKS